MTPFVGEIRMFAGTFAPAGWAFCAGQLQSISENETLFQLIGTTYGGDGQETFALPSLCSRVPLHMGTGPGGSTRQLAEMSGAETVTLTVNQIPSHSHVPVANSTSSGTSPTNSVSAGSTDLAQYAPATGTTTLMQANSMSFSGGSQPHNNMLPYLTINYIISLYGIFPSPT